MTDNAAVCQGATSLSHEYPAQQSRIPSGCSSSSECSIPRTNRAARVSKRFPREHHGQEYRERNRLLTRAARRLVDEAVPNRNCSREEPRLTGCGSADQETYASSSADSALSC